MKLEKNWIWNDDFYSSDLLLGVLKKEISEKDITEERLSKYEEFNFKKVDIER